MQAHEGKVWARSKPGQGTTFVLRLRRLDAEKLDASLPDGMAREEDCDPPGMHVTTPVAVPAAFAAAAAEGGQNG
jgi:hypothetical protein